MLKRFLIYGFPIYLMIIEWAMHEAQIVSHASALGPSLTAVALSFMGSVVVTKTSVIEVEGRKLTVVSPADRAVSDAGWVVLFLMLAVWASSLYLAERPIVLSPVGYSVAASTALGLASYFVGVVFSELKGVA